MKKIYNAPQADLLCFRPMEDLAAINFEDLVKMEDLASKDNSPAETSAQDILIPIG